MRNKVVSHDAWLQARRELLAAEKEFTRQRDALIRQRQALPWEKVEKDYTFEGPDGPLTLSELFGSRSQLAVYHFMLGPDWEEGCKSCSFWADNFEGIPVHLAQRDVTFIAVSRAPLARIEAYRTRMGWSFPWVSSHGSDFNFDYQASYTPNSSPRARSTTTTIGSKATASCRASASSPRTRRGRSSTATPPTAAASRRSTAPTTSSTSSPKAAMRRPSTSPWPGCNGTTSIEESDGSRLTILSLSLLEKLIQSVSLRDCQHTRYLLVFFSKCITLTQQLNISKP